MQFRQNGVVGPEAAADLLDVLLRRLKKCHEVNRVLRQERDAARAGERTAGGHLPELRSRLQEQMAVLENEYQRARRNVARQVGLDDMDFATLLGCLTPEPAAFLRRAGNELAAAGKEMTALREEIEAELSRRSAEMELPV